MPTADAATRPPGATATTTIATPAPRPTGGCAVLAAEESALEGITVPKSGERGPCAHGAGGVWALTVRAAPKVDHMPLLELTHLAGDRTRVAAPLEDRMLTTISVAKDSRSNCASCECGTSALKLMSTHDFDHDGIPEVWVRLRRDESYEVGADGLFTLRGGQIVPYPPAKGLDEFEVSDVDQDGIPDLIYRQKLGGGYEAGCGAPIPGTYSPLLVAHAEADGTFAFDDDVARKAARDACPSPAGQPETPQTLVEVFCARVWGVPTARRVHLERAKERCYFENRPKPGPHEGCEVTGCRACPAEADLADLTRFKPRVTLREP
jgi:hypothetical protein